MHISKVALSALSLLPSAAVANPLNVGGISTDVGGVDIGSVLGSILNGLTGGGVGGGVVGGIIGGGSAGGSAGGASGSASFGLVASAQIATTLDTSATNLEGALATGGTTLRTSANQVLKALRAIPVVKIPANPGTGVPGVPTPDPQLAAALASSIQTLQAGVNKGGAQLQAASQQVTGELRSLANRVRAALNGGGPGLPTITIPTIGLPTVTLPSVTLPTITIPSVTIPTIPTPTIPSGNGVRDQLAAALAAAAARLEGAAGGSNAQLRAAIQQTITALNKAAAGAGTGPGSQNIRALIQAAVARLQAGLKGPAAQLPNVGTDASAFLRNLAALLQANVPSTPGTPGAPTLGECAALLGIGDIGVGNGNTVGVNA